MIEKEELYLPKELLDKSIKSGKEFGWLREDFEFVIKTARNLEIAIIGGQTQFKFPDGICELYWRKFDTKPKEIDENWQEYCKRTAFECLDHFKKIPSDYDLRIEGIENFKFLKDMESENVEFEKHLIIIIYFENKPVNEK